MRTVLDEIFGTGGSPGTAGFRNEIAWKSTTAHSDSRRYGTNHQTIFFYTKGSDYIWNEQLADYDQEYVDAYYRYKEADGRRFKSGDLSAAGLQGGGYRYEWKGHTKLWRCPKETMQRLHDDGKIFYTRNGLARKKDYLDEAKGISAQTIWADKAVQYVVSWGTENTGYETQKSEGLLGRIIAASSNEGDLVMDCFAGSGTTLAVAEKMGRKWIGCDLGRFAVHTCRKRLIGVQREMKAAAKTWRSFEILNLGRYERQYFVGIDPTLPEEQRKALSVKKEAEFVQLILQAYKAQTVDQTPPFHGRKAGAFVVVGPIDAPVTRALIDEAVEAARAMRAARVDVLGFEFEMGLVPQAQEEARARGVGLTLKHIPKDVFDKRAVDKDQVAFHDIAYLDARVRKQGLTVTVELNDFGVFYSQGDIDAMTATMKNKSTKVQVDRGQVWKISKDKDGIITREQLTRHWTDWIDYWAVDFNFESKCELVTITDG